MQTLLSAKKIANRTRSAAVASHWGAQIDAGFAKAAAAILAKYNQAWKG